MAGPLEVIPHARSSGVKLPAARWQAGPVDTRHSPDTRPDEAPLMDLTNILSWA